MKTTLLALAAIAVTASGAMAAERGRHYDRHGSISGFERAQIARSAAHLAQVRHRVWSDGRLTRFERVQVRAAEARHRAIVARARRS